MRRTVSRGAKQGNHLNDMLDLAVRYSQFDISFFFGYTWITIIEVNSRSQCPFFSIVRFSFIANKIFFYFLYSLLKYLWNQRAYICY